jgi:hypothetical protein
MPRRSTPGSDFGPHQIFIEFVVACREGRTSIPKCAPSIPSRGRLSCGRRPNVFLVLVYAVMPCWSHCVVCFNWRRCISVCLRFNGRRDTDKKRHRSVEASDTDKKFRSVFSDELPCKVSWRHRSLQK